MKSKLTEPIKKKIIEAIQAGAWIKTACLYAGITESCFYNWKKQAEDGKEPYLQFFESLKGVEANLEKELAETWVEIAKGNKDFRAIAEFMKRRFKDNWNIEDKHEISGNLSISWYEQLTKEKDESS